MYKPEIKVEDVSLADQTLKIESENKEQNQNQQIQNCLSIEGMLQIKLQLKTERNSSYKDYSLKLKSEIEEKDKKDQKQSLVPIDETIEIKLENEENQVCKLALSSSENVQKFHPRATNPFILQNYHY